MRVEGLGAEGGGGGGVEEGGWDGRGFGVQGFIDVEADSRDLQIHLQS